MEQKFTQEKRLKREIAHNLLEEGIEAYRRRDFEGTVAKCKASLQNGQINQAYFYKALALEELQRQQEAAQTFRKGVEVMRQTISVGAGNEELLQYFVISLLKIASIHLKQGRFDLALKEVEETEGVLPACQNQSLQKVALSLRKEIREKQEDRKFSKEKLKLVQGEYELTKLSQEIVSSNLAQVSKRYEIREYSEDELIKGLEKQRKQENKTKPLPEKKLQGLFLKTVKQLDFAAKVGFVNKGNRCYLNAALQILAGVPQIAAHLTDAQWTVRNIANFEFYRSLKKRLKTKKSASKRQLALQGALNGGAELKEEVKQDSNFDSFSLNSFTIRRGTVKRREIKFEEEKKEEDEFLGLDQHSNGILLYSFANIVRDLWFPRQHKFLDCSCLRSIFCSLVPYFDNNEQHDTGEFLLQFLDILLAQSNLATIKFQTKIEAYLDKEAQLQKALKQTNIRQYWTLFNELNDSWVTSNFYGLQSLHSTCDNCKHRSQTHLEVFNALMLPLPTARELKVKYVPTSSSLRQSLKPIRFYIYLPLQQPPHTKNILAKSTEILDNLSSQVINFNPAFLEIYECEWQGLTSNLYLFDANLGLKSPDNELILYQNRNFEQIGALRIQVVFTIADQTLQHLVLPFSPEVTLKGIRAYLLRYERMRRTASIKAFFGMLKSMSMQQGLKERKSPDPFLGSMTSMTSSLQQPQYLQILLDFHIPPAASHFGEVIVCDICGGNHIHAQPCDLTFFEPNTTLRQLQEIMRKQPGVTKMQVKVKFNPRMSTFELREFERITTISKERILKYIHSMTLQQCLYNCFNSVRQACEKCKAERATVHTELEVVPPILMFYFNRFQFDGKSVSKNEMWVQFPEVLDLASVIDTRSKLTYRLMGVIYHEGNVGAGHYTCARKDFGKWYKFDDQRVGLANQLVSQKAYFLVYKIM